MARVGRYMRRGKRIVPVDPYTSSSFAAKREHALRLCGIAPEPLLVCRTCAGQGTPLKVPERDWKGHMQRSHPGVGAGETKRKLFNRVKRGER